MTLPARVSNNKYTIVYAAGDTFAYRTAKQSTVGEKDKDFMTVFTALTVAEYTTIIASDWS